MEGARTSVYERLRLDGRVAVVTGASSGLGAELARTLAEAGATVVAAARRKDRLEALAAELPSCVPVACDVTVRADLEQLVRVARETCGPIEVLLNVAGALHGAAPAEDESDESIDATIALNLVAPFRLAQLTFPDMKALGRGAIVNVTSISGIVGIPGIPQASYAATKRGLSGLTTDLAVQWGRHGVRVNCLAAGFFRSELTEPMYTDERSLAWLERNTLVPGHGTPADLGGAVLWLVTDAGRYVTGQTIVVDGGWTTR